ncbi:MAG TPA: cyclodeaminase/cyclohydrolase family protein [Ktedonobacterales bacterium]
MSSNTPVGDFVAGLASSAPTPGGGAASALVGALAAALAAMMGQLTIGRARFRDVEAPIQDMLGQLTALRAELLRLMDEDAAAYGEVARAYALPRASDDDRASRDSAIQAALRQAMEPPRRVARCSVDTMRVAARLAAIGNPNVISDVGCAAVLGEATVRCANLNVLANVVLIHDRAAGAEARAEAAALEGQVAQLLAQVMTVVRARLGA